MQIELKQLVPTPLAESINPDSDVWNQNITLETGERIIVDAQSGKGKSTFIQTIYGIRQDYTGDISFDGKGIRTMSKIDLAELRQSKISILFQDLRLFHELSAKDNILVKTLHQTCPHNFTVEKLAAKLNVSHLMDRKAELLSYGERQRIATIRALMQPFEWIFLDEPFSHLDEANTLASFQLIKDIADINNAGVIITTLGKDPFLDFDKTLKL